MELELVDKPWARKINSSSKFFQSHAIKCLNRIYVILWHVALSRGGKMNTIGLVGGTNAKLPHCTCRALAYPMENEMPFVHHAVEWWG
jgi:hypothetical protein